MPAISMFYGLIIRMYFKDHNPPHIHIQYGDWNATMGFDGKIMSGSFAGCAEEIGCCVVRNS